MNTSRRTKPAIMKFYDNPCFRNSPDLIGPQRKRYIGAKKSPSFFLFTFSISRTHNNICGCLRSTIQEDPLPNLYSQWLLCKRSTQLCRTCLGAGALRRTSSQLVLFPALLRGTWSLLVLTSWLTLAEYVHLLCLQAFMPMSGYRC